MRPTLLSLFVVAAAVCVAPLVASAQPGPAPASSSASLTGASSGHGRGFGAGAAEMFGRGSGAPNLLLTWGDDRGVFNVDGLFGLFHQEGHTDFDVGARFWYHIHASSYADFSLGGGLMVLSRRQDNRNDRGTDFALNLGGQVRVFLVPNVALLGTIGLAAYFPDVGGDDIRIGGQTTGSLGVAYFFE